MVKSSTKSRAPHGANGTLGATAARAPRKASASAAPVAPAKMVRDRFTLPQVDYDRLDALKSRMRSIGHPTKKNALLRVGLLMLSALSDDTLKQLLDQLPPASTHKTSRVSRSSKRAPD